MENILWFLLINFVLGYLLITTWGKAWANYKWNDGSCRKCGGKWTQQQTGTPGYRLYRCPCRNYVWIVEK